MIHPIAVPITCRENPIDVSSPVGALAKFYRAFNARDLRLMQANLAGGDEPVMDNPLGGILRGWRNIQTTYERFFWVCLTFRAESASGEATFGRVEVRRLRDRTSRA